LPEKKKTVRHLNCLSPFPHVVVGEHYDNISDGLVTTMTTFQRAWITAHNGKTTMKTKSTMTATPPMTTTTLPTATPLKTTTTTMPLPPTRTTTMIPTTTKVTILISYSTSFELAEEMHRNEQK
jgi:hypothetical protein